MTWTRHYVEISESCSRHHHHVGECIKEFLQQSMGSVSQASSYEMYGSMVSWGVGCIVFPLCLGAFQIGVFKPLSLTASTILAPAFGFCSVVASGIAASLTVLFSHSRFHHAPDHKDIDIRFPDIICYGLGTAVLFKLLRGQFRSVLPSTILQPGAFATRGIPATKNYATSGKKARLAAMGSRHGCHTCGKRWTAKMFIADHQPPLSVPKRRDLLNMLTKVFRLQQPDYRFYPQCPDCSRIQQGYLSAMALQRTGDLAPGKAVRVDHSHIVTHATSFRMYHLYLPLPIVLTAAYHICAL